jgi:hypothetical protein
MPPGENPGFPGNLTGAELRIDGAWAGVGIGIAFALAKSSLDMFEADAGGVYDTVGPFCTICAETGMDKATSIAATAAANITVLSIPSSRF